MIFTTNIEGGTVTLNITVTPSAAHSRASALVSPSTAARAALECVIPASPWCGESVTLITLPPPPGRNASS